MNRAPLPEEIDNDDRLPSSATYRERFGGIYEAYTYSGVYHPVFDFTELWAEKGIINFDKPSEEDRIKAQLIQLINDAWPASAVQLERSVRYNNSTIKGERIGKIDIAVPSKRVAFECKDSDERHMMKGIGQTACYNTSKYNVALAVPGNHQPRYIKEASMRANVPLVSVYSNGVHVDVPTERGVVV